MNKFFRPLLTVLALALGTTSCDKQQAAPQSPVSVTVAHDANAFEYIGEQHNQGLDYYLANARFNDPRPDIDPLTIQFCQTLGYSQADIEKTLYDPETAAIITAAHPGDALRTYFRANNQRQELAYFDQIDNAVRRSASAAAAVAQLQGLEQTVQADKTLQPASQEALLQGIAVGTHSAAYWDDQVRQGPRSPWLTKAAGGAAVSLRINWGEVVMADVSGAIKGGVKGAIKASINNLIDQIF
jgi:hypothetical protein